MLTVDSRVPDDLLAQVGADIEASVIKQIEITED